MKKIDYQKEEYEEKILQLIDNRDEFTRSDLQGIVSVLVETIMEGGEIK